MLIRFSSPESDPNPGPAQNPTETTLYKGTSQPKFSIAHRTKGLSLDCGPAPNAAPTPLSVFKPRAPCYAMPVRLKGLPLDRVPGPNVYDADIGKLKVMKQSPAFSHRWRSGDPKADKKPGPMDYNLAQYNPFDKGASFTMGRRLTEFRHNPIVPMDNCWAPAEQFESQQPNKTEFRKNVPLFHSFRSANFQEIDE